jgi:hypothetical protein
VQASVYVPVAATGPTVSLPDTLLAPDHAPLAVQLVALALFHVRVDEPFTASAVGFAENERVGGGVGASTDTATVF